MGDAVNVRSLENGLKCELVYTDPQVTPKLGAVFRKNLMRYHNHCMYAKMWTYILATRAMNLTDTDRSDLDNAFASPPTYVTLAGEGAAARAQTLAKLSATRKSC